MTWSGLNDDESNDAPVDSCTPRTSQPTRNAAIAARSMLKLWLDPDDIDDDDVPPSWGVSRITRETNYVYLCYVTCTTC